MIKRFVKVPYPILNLKVSVQTKYLFVSLMHFRSGRKKSIKVSMKKVSEISGMKERQMSTHIKKLCNLCVLSRRQTYYGNTNYGCNIYTITCSENYYAAIPWEVAFNSELTAYSVIGYCVLKRNIDLRKNDFACFLTKQQLANQIGCSLNHVDKIKRNLRKAGLIEFGHNDIKITLIYEKMNAAKS